MKCGEVFKGAEKAVLLVYANYANDQDEAYPSTPEASWTSGVSERNVRRVQLDLEDLGVMKLLRRGGGRVSALYELNSELLNAMADDLFRIKQAAKRDGADRHRAMRKRATELRAWLHDEMMADPNRGLRWRERRRKAEKYQEDYRDRRRRKRDDVESSPKDGKKISDKSGSHPSPDSTSAGDDVESSLPCHIESSESVKEKSQKPSRERAQSTRAAREPPAPSGSIGCEASKEVYPDEHADNQPPCAPGGSAVSVKRIPDKRHESLARERSSANPNDQIQDKSSIGAMSTALGCAVHAVMLRCGSVRAAQELADRWRAGEVSLSDVRQRLDQTCDPPADAA